MSSGGGTGSSGSSRLKKTARVVAVADQRTYSVVVSAPQQLIDQIEEIVSNLDASAARKQTVRVMHFSNATPAQVKSALAALFQKQTTTSPANSASQNQADALETRMTTQSQSQSSATTRSGTGGGSPSGLSGGGGGSAGGGSVP